MKYLPFHITEHFINILIYPVLIIILLACTPAFAQVLNPSQDLHNYKVLVGTTINNNIQGITNNSFNAEVLLDIDNKGMPDDIKILKSTGDSKLDDTIVEKIKELSPFDELPASYASDSIKFIVIVSKRSGLNNFSYLPPNYYSPPVSSPPAQNTFTYQYSHSSTTVPNTYNNQQYQQPFLQSNEGYWIRSLLMNQVNYWIQRKYPGIPYMNIF